MCWVRAMFKTDLFPVTCHLRSAISYFRAVVLIVLNTEIPILALSSSLRLLGKNAFRRGPASVFKDRLYFGTRFMRMV